MVDGESTLGILSDGPLGFIYDGNPYDKDPKVKVLNFLSSGSYAESFNLQPLSQIRQELEEALKKIFPGIGQEILSWEFFRYHPRAIASWPVGRSRFDKLSGVVRSPVGRLYLAGDFTENTHSDGAVRSAFRVVEVKVVPAAPASSHFDNFINLRINLCPARCRYGLTLFIIINEIGLIPPSAVSRRLLE
ncbi:MAG: FAD-dependent oxidoreductase [Deltaproteobacteria bacterium]|nr:FAD-dependent oxidoreductase [Deltaproteobacteria bacterium]